MPPRKTDLHPSATMFPSILTLCGFMGETKRVAPVPTSTSPATFTFKRKQVALAGTTRLPLIVDPLEMVPVHWVVFWASATGTAASRNPSTAMIATAKDFMFSGCMTFSSLVVLISVGVVYIMMAER